MRRSRRWTRLVTCLASIGLATLSPALAADRIEASVVGSGDELNPIALEISSDGSSLTLLVETDRDVDAYLRGNMASDVVEILIDTDLDADTGGQTFKSENFGALGGYEYMATVYACKSFADGSEVCAGDAGGRVTRTYSSYEPSRWQAAGQEFEEIYDLFWSGGSRPLEGPSLRLEIPYRDLGVRSGAEIRISVVASRYRGSKFPDARITLR
ncbi:MAG: hypothetical protein R3190_01430 [Thermoanaerobaculia bacterium]|nr:hypothetical protein [Thermoanaerobaculia bacterium]